MHLLQSEQQSFLFFLLQGFDVFRGDKTLCDVVLIPGDDEETFLVHRVIMASSSDYFKAMFTGESNHNEYNHSLSSEWMLKSSGYRVNFSGK